MSTVIADLVTVPAWVILVLVFALPALEASTFLGLVVPGETMVIAGGVAAHAGRVQLLLVVLLAVSGAVVGDQAGFLLGRRYGSRLSAWAPPGSRRAQSLSRGLEFVATRGVLAVALGRWVAALRSVVPFVAGMGEMGRARFTVANGLGGALWAAAVAVAGYLAGASFRVAEQRLGAASYLLLAAGVLVVAAWWSRGHVRTRRPSGATRHHE